MKSSWLSSLWGLGTGMTNLPQCAIPVTWGRLPEQPHVVVPPCKPSPARPVGEQACDLRVTDGTREMDCCRVSSDDLVHGHHHLSTVHEVLVLIGNDAQAIGLLDILHLDAMYLHITERSDERFEWDCTWIISVARSAHGPADANPATRRLFPLHAGRLD